MFRMWNVWVMKCFGYEMFRMWNVWDVVCLECWIFGIWDVRCRKVPGMWDVDLENVLKYTYIESIN